MIGKSTLKTLVPNVGLNNISAREKWIKETLSNLPKGLRILDAGAGTQQYKKYCGHLKYVSQDFGQYDGKGDEAGLQMGDFDYGELDIISDITSIPEPDGSFDVIMCNEVLEHLLNPVEAVREFSRLIKSGGLIIITAPFCSLTHFAPYHYSTGFNRYWYEGNLAEYGFEQIEVYPNGNYFEYIAQELYRIPAVTKKYSSSKIYPWNYFFIYGMQQMLKRLSRNDLGSNELLCYGFHVIARKSMHLKIN